MKSALALKSVCEICSCEHEGEDRAECRYVRSTQEIAQALEKSKQATEDLKKSCKVKNETVQKIAKRRKSVSP